MKIPYTSLSCLMNLRKCSNKKLKLHILVLEVRKYEVFKNDLCNQTIGNHLGCPGPTQVLHCWQKSSQWLAGIRDQSTAHIANEQEPRWMTAWAGCGPGWVEGRPRVGQAAAPTATRQSLNGCKSPGLGYSTSWQVLFMMSQQ